MALSNQFFSKTTRNLAENPRASLLLIDPVAYDEFRLTVVYERTERRGRVFERLRDDVDMVASLSGMSGRVQAAAPPTSTGWSRSSRCSPQCTAGAGSIR